MLERVEPPLPWSWTRDHGKSYARCSYPLPSLLSAPHGLLLVLQQLGLLPLFRGLVGKELLPSLATLDDEVGEDSEGAKDDEAKNTCCDANLGRCRKSFVVLL